MVPTTTRHAIRDRGDALLLEPLEDDPEDDPEGVDEDVDAGVAVGVVGLYVTPLTVAAT
jgi:hypothetical protein